MKPKAFAILAIAMIVAASPGYAATPTPVREQAPNTQRTTDGVVSPQTRLALSVSPAIVEVVLEKGEVVERTVTLRNITTAPLLVKASRQSFSPEERREIPEDLRTKYDASSWIGLDEDDADFVLKPEEAKEVTLRIRQPSNAAPGGHYASLMFQPLVPENSIAQDSVYVYGQVAVLVFMQVRGEIVEDVTLERMEVASVYESRPVMNVTLKNRGNTHTRPEGTVVIRDNHGKTIHSLTLVPGLLLPGISKTYEMTWQDKDMPLGFFSAQARVKYGREGSLTSPEHSFMVLPFIRISFTLIIAGAIVFVFVKARKRFLKALRVLLHTDDSPPRKRQVKPIIDKRFPRR
jgi:hypothetical protein